MSYPYKLQIPELVVRAHKQAEAIGFPLLPQGRPIGRPAPTTAITPMDGALLRCLAALFPQGLIGEIGTGPGVSASWLLSGMGKGARLVTCEIDAQLASLAATFFVDRPGVEVRHGDWQEALTRDAPFDLLFFDADAQAFLAEKARWDQLLTLLKIGGILVMDDLFPVEMWPDEWKGQTDHKREFCLCNPRVAGAEIRTSPTTVSVLATRLA